MFIRLSNHVSVAVKRSTRRRRRLRLKRIHQSTKDNQHRRTRHFTRSVDCIWLEREKQLLLTRGVGHFFKERERERNQLNERENTGTGCFFASSAPFKFKKKWIILFFFSLSLFSIKFFKKFLYNNTHGLVVLWRVCEWVRALLSGGSSGILLAFRNCPPQAAASAVKVKHLPSNLSPLLAWIMDRIKNDKCCWCSNYISISSDSDHKNLGPPTAFYLILLIAQCRIEQIVHFGILW